MTKKLVLLLLLVVAMNAPAYAGAGVVNNGRGEYSGDLVSSGSPYVVKAMPGLVYNITFIPTAANGKVTLFDTNTTTTTGLVAVYEAASATTGVGVTIDMSAAPINLYTGIVAVVTNGDAYINYQ